MPQQEPNLGTVNPSTALAWTAAAGITFLILGARQPRPHLTHAITVPAEEVRHA